MEICDAIIINDKFYPMAENLDGLKELENKLVSLGGDPSLVRTNMYRKTGTYKKL